MSVIVRELVSSLSLPVKVVQRFYRYWVSQIFDPVRSLAAIRGFYTYFRDWKKYNQRSGTERLRFMDSYPCFFDRNPKTPFDAHYLYQAVWATEKVIREPAIYHVDVGSEVRFVAMLSAYIPITFVDIRPVKIDGLKNIICKKNSIHELPFEDASLNSISCLHVAEHVGLGRYGDPLDPEGTKKACQELARVLAPGGNLYFSVPVGHPRAK